MRLEVNQAVRSLEGLQKLGVRSKSRLQDDPQRSSRLDCHFSVPAALYNLPGIATVVRKKHISAFLYFTAKTVIK